MYMNSVAIYFFLANSCIGVFVRCDYFHLKMVIVRVQSCKTISPEDFGVLYKKIFPQNNFENLE